MPKTYTRSVKNENGEEVIETYDSRTDSLVSKKTLKADGGYELTTYRAGTTIPAETLVYKKDEKEPCEITKFHETAPYQKSYEKSEYGGEKYFYNTQSNRLKQYNYQENGYFYEVSYDRGGQVTQMVTKRENGTVKEITQQTWDGWSNEILREDGTVYQSGVYRNSDKSDPISECNHYKNGDVFSKMYLDENGNKVKELYNRGNKIHSRDVFSPQGKQLESYIYNSDGSVRQKVIFDGSEKVSSQVTNKQITLDETNYDGIIDENSKIIQGSSGTCYFASTIKNLALTEERRQILAKAVDRSEESTTGIRKITYFGKTYEVSKEEVEKAYGRLGNGDPDYTAMAVAWEKCRLDKFDKTVESGLPADVIEGLTGKKPMYKTFDVFPITSDELDTMQKLFETKQVFMTAGTDHPSVDKELTDEEIDNGLMHMHAYTIKSINSDNVTVIDPRDGEEYTYSRETFMKHFCNYFVQELN